MLYIESSILDQLNATLSQIETSDCKICGSLEVFLCKFDGKDKKLLKELENNYLEEVNNTNNNSNINPNIKSVELSKTAAEYFLSSSHEDNYMVDSAFDLQNPIHRKVFYKLIFTLNSAFPDYDFSGVKPRHFEKIGFGQMKANVEALLLNYQVNSNLLRKIWEAICLTIGSDSASDIRDLKPSNSMSNFVESALVGIDIYRYLPYEYDPYSSGEECEDSVDAMWSFNYLFYNRKHKRILFFTMFAQRLNLIEPEEVSEIELEQEDNLEAAASIQVESKFPSANAFRIPRSSAKAKSISLISSYSSYPVMYYNLKRKRQ